MRKDKFFYIVMFSIGIGAIICTFLYMKFSDFAIINRNMLANLKYTIGVVSSDKYFNKGAGDGYDYQFTCQKGFMTGHENGNLIRFRKYLVVYDSVKIKNGFLILDDYDVTDSLVNKNIDEKAGWSLEKLPFAFDKQALDAEVRDLVKMRAKK